MPTWRANGSFAASIRLSNERILGASGKPIGDDRSCATEVAFQSRYSGPVHPQPLQRVLASAEAVRDALQQLFGSMALTQPRMSDLTRLLALDKSIASRLARAVRAESASASLRDLPGTDALEDIVTRSAKQGATASALETARQAVTALDTALREFPGDRTTLAAAIAGVAGGLPTKAGEPSTASPARLKAARRGAYDAFVFAQGIACDTQSCITILMPGSEPGRAHQAMVLGTTGLRRMRPGHPYSLLSLQGRPGSDASRDRTTLTGEPVRDDPSIAMIPGFCSPSASRLRLERVGRHYTLVLEPDVPPLDEPMDVAFGLVNPNFEHCRKLGDNRWSMTSYTVARPCRIFVREVLLHRDTFAGCVPRAIFSIDSIPVPNLDEIGPDPSGRGFVEHGEALEPMGLGYDRRGPAAHDFVVPLALRAFELLRRDPADFVRFRMVVEYPLPMVRGEVWMELPD